MTGFCGVWYDAPRSKRLFVMNGALIYMADINVFCERKRVRTGGLGGACVGRMSAPISEELFH